MSDFFMISNKELTYADGSLYIIRLIVVQDTGIEVKPLYNIKYEKMNNTSSDDAPSHFHNGGYQGVKFTIDVMLRENHTLNRAVYYNNKTKKTAPKLRYILHRWIKFMMPVDVVSEAVEIPNGTYIMTNSTRKQSYKDYGVWSLEFVTYNKAKIWKFINGNRLITTTSKTTAKTTTSKSSYNTTLSKCALNTLVYSKTKKVVKCVSYMQTVLYKKGFLTKAQVDGWFGPVTANAVKKFQTKYAKTYNLKATGKVDKNTLNAMCRV